MTRYGKIDLLWFDGKPPIPNGNNVITVERIRELQPGIVINTRLHGRGDFITYERQLATDKIAAGWAEFCNTWTNSWPHVAGAPFRANGYDHDTERRTQANGCTAARQREDVEVRIR